MATILSIMPPRPSVRRRQAHALAWHGVLTGVLVTALLFMQLLGLVHGIAHAGWPPTDTNQAQLSRNAALFNYLDVDDDDDERAVPIDASAATPLAQLQPGLAEPSTHHHHHSCVEYDAAAGTAGVHVDYFPPPLLPGTSVQALWKAFASWDAPFVRHFSSRAPPC